MNFRYQIATALAGAPGVDLHHRPTLSRQASAAAGGHRLPQLDFFRGIAILLVLGSHIHSLSSQSVWDVMMALPLMYAGWSGVPLFFVLSGFLVSGLLFSEYKTTGSINASRFLARRGFKIYPAFYAYLLFCIALCSMTNHSVDWKGMLYEALFVQNYTYCHSLMPHTWSLAVEEHFYLAMTLVFVLMLKYRSSPKAIPYFCIFLMILSLVGRMLTVGPHYPIATHLRIDALAFGVLLAYLQHYNPGLLLTFANYKYNKAIYGCLILVGVAVRPELHWFGYIFGLTFLYIGFGGLLIRGIYGGWKNSFLNRTVACVGVYSYSIYLWHLLIWHELSIIVGHNFLLFAQAGIYVILSVSIGIAMAKLVECPMLRLREMLVEA